MKERGFALLELVIAIAVMGILAVPMSQYLVSVVRAGDAAERRLERVGAASVSAAVASRASVSDECAPDGYEAAISARVALRGLQAHVEANCDAVPTILTITVTDERGDTSTVLAVRP